MRRALVITSIAAMVVACGDDPNTLTTGSRGSYRAAAPDDTNQASAPASPTQAAPTSTSTQTPPAPMPSSTGSSSPMPTGTGTASTPPPSTAEDVCVKTINDYRKTLGLAPLARWTSAETCADGEAQNDGTKSVAHGAFPSCGEFGQNECPGWPGAPAAMIPNCLAAMWAEGPGGGHYQNMASTMWTKVSCGFYTLPSGAVWAVQDFR